MKPITKKEYDQLENIRVKYQASLNLFSSEGTIQWTRYSVALAVNTIIISLLSIYQNKNYLKHAPAFILHLLSFAPYIGIFTCFIWFFMTMKGFIWANHWIEHARLLEEKLPGGVNPVIEGNIKRLKKPFKLFKTEIGSYIIIFLFISIYILVPYPFELAYYYLSLIIVFIYKLILNYIIY